MSSHVGVLVLTHVSVFISVKSTIIFYACIQQYFTLAFNSTFYFGAYFTEQYFTLRLHSIVLFTLVLILLSSTLLTSTHIFY
jgi:hypothetical protein